MLVMLMVPHKEQTVHMFIIMIMEWICAFLVNHLFFRLDLTFQFPGSCWWYLIRDRLCVHMEQTVWVFIVNFIMIMEWFCAFLVNHLFF